MVRTISGGRIGTNSSLREELAKGKSIEEISYKAALEIRERFEETRQALTAILGEDQGYAHNKITEALSLFFKEIITVAEEAENKKGSPIDYRLFHENGLRVSMNFLCPEVFDDPNHLYRELTLAIGKLKQGSNDGSIILPRVQLLTAPQFGKQPEDLSISNDYTWIHHKFTDSAVNVVSHYATLDMRTMTIYPNTPSKLEENKYDSTVSHHFYMAVHSIFGDMCNRITQICRTDAREKNLRSDRLK